MKILETNRDHILSLDPKDIVRSLDPIELFYIAGVLGAFWSYDYERVHDRPGYHAELKPGLHSDAFFASKILLGFPNIRSIISLQMAMKIREYIIHTRPVDYVAGIPDSATTLGTDIAKLLGIKPAQMEKKNDKIVLVDKLPDHARILLVEDVCTRGTGFLEAFAQIWISQPAVQVVNYNPVILNRGGLHFISRNSCFFKILPLINHQIQDWTPEDCPLCQLGSTPIKPKATEENWRLITTAQK